MTSILVSLLLWWALAPQPAGERALRFDGKGWQLQGERTAIVNENGRDVLLMETGFAHRRDVQLEDGTIDFDVQVTRRRSFVYVHFRSVSEEEREEFYLRPHKSGLPDAVQYAPVFQGRSSWQLYHGAGGTASIEFDPGVWTPVRIVLKGRSAALFVKDMNTPALLVPQLAREPRAGAIALGGFLPADTPGAGAIARFSNVRITPGVPAFDLDAAVARAKRAGPAPGTAAPTAVRAAQVIESWAVSRSFVPKDTSETGPSLPAADVTGQFQKVEAYPGGLVELHRHVQVPKGSRITAAVARVHVRAATAGTYPLELGFSDTATVFLNGRPVYRGNASYSYDLPRREGLIEFEQARLFLPLNAGDNDLSILVSDGFGGWGLMGRFVGAQGLTVEPR